MAQYDADDMHDWDTFNQQIEKLLLSMQKTDKAPYQSLASDGLEQSLLRSAGREQRPSFASILEHADIRQNLSESAFEHAATAIPTHDRSASEEGTVKAANSPAATGQQSQGKALAHDLQPAKDGFAPQEIAQPATSSPDMQSPCETIPCSTSNRADESAVAQLSVPYTMPGTQCLGAGKEQSAGTAMGQVVQIWGDAGQPSISPAAPPRRAGETGMEKQPQLEENPYRLLLQQIDLHIATCQASLASIYPVEQGIDSAEPTTPAQAKPAQASPGPIFPTQHADYRNELYEALPENLDSPWGIAETHPRRKAMAPAHQPSADEVIELMAAESTQAQPAVSSVSPAALPEHQGPASTPAAAPCSAEKSKVAAEQDAQWQAAPQHAAGCAALPSERTAGQRAALAEQGAPLDSTDEPAGYGREQWMCVACFLAEGRVAEQLAQGLASQRLEASSAVMEHEEPVPQASSAVQEEAGPGSVTTSDKAELALRPAASGHGAALEAPDEVEQEQPQLIAAWWPPAGAQRSEQEHNLPGLGSGQPQRPVSVEIRDAEQCRDSRSQSEVSAPERDIDTGRSPCRILRLSLSPPCSGHRESPTGGAEVRSPTMPFPAEVMNGLHKENTSPELPGLAPAHEPDATEAGRMELHEPQGLCGAIASPTADQQGRDLQAWHHCTATGLLEVYQDIALQQGGNIELLHEHFASASPTEGLDTADERVHQAGLARRRSEMRQGAQAVDLAERDTQVAYLSNAVGLAEDLLTAKQRKVAELSGESLGLQDVLSEAGAEAAMAAMRLKELEAETKQQQAQLAQAQQQLAGKEWQLAQCRASLADAQSQLAAAQAATSSPFAANPSLVSRSHYTSPLEKLSDAQDPSPMSANMFSDSVPRPILFTIPGASETAGSPMPAMFVRGLHGAVPGSSRRALRSAWDAVTPPASHVHTMEALTAVLSRIRRREEPS